MGVIKTCFLEQVALKLRSEWRRYCQVITEKGRPFSRVSSGGPRTEEVGSPRRGGGSRRGAWGSSSQCDHPVHRGSSLFVCSASFLLRESHVPVGTVRVQETEGGV